MRKLGAVTFSFLIFNFYFLLYIYRLQGFECKDFSSSTKGSLAFLRNALTICVKYFKMRLPAIPLR